MEGRREFLCQEHAICNRRDFLKEAEGYFFEDEVVDDFIDPLVGIRVDETGWLRKVTKRDDCLLRLRGNCTNIYKQARVCFPSILSR